MIQATTTKTKPQIVIILSDLETERCEIVKERKGTAGLTREAHTDTIECIDAKIARFEQQLKLALV